MELTKNDLNELISCHTTVPSPQGFIAYLGPHQYISSNGKKIFPSRKTLMLSMRQTIGSHIRAIIMRNLTAKGMTRSDAYSSSDYNNAWKNFLKQAQDSKFIRVVELK